MKTMPINGIESVVPMLFNRRVVNIYHLSFNQPNDRLSTKNEYSFIAVLSIYK